MAVCQAEGIGRLRITSPLQVVKKLRPHHKFDFPLFSEIFYFDVKFPQRHLSATFRAINLIKIKLPETYKRLFHLHSRK
jgi:hypothetical protein